MVRIDAKLAGGNKGGKLCILEALFARTGVCASGIRQYRLYPAALDNCAVIKHRRRGYLVRREKRRSRAWLVGNDKRDVVAPAVLDLGADSRRAKSPGGTDAALD